MDAAPAFVAQSRAYLRDTYHPKLLRCVEQLTDDELWWRPNAASNSVGNLLLHLAGNIRQWIVHGVGGAADVRERPLEFSTQGGVPRADLLRRLEDALHAVDAVLAGLDAATLQEHRRIQGNDVSVLQAVYHVVEHFGYHVGQVTYITKLLKDVDLAFWHVQDGNAVPNWKTPRT